MSPRTGAAVVDWLAGLGQSPGDEEAVRVAKSTLAVSVSLIAVLATVWVGIYLAFGRPWSALIPFIFQIAVVVALATFARTKRLATLRVAFVLLMGTLPFVLQWSLGGFSKGSAVAMWAIVAPMLAILFGGRPAPWIALFVGLSLVSVLIDPWLARSIPALPRPVVSGFFALNLIGPAATALAATWYSTAERDRARAELAGQHRLLEIERERSELLLLNILPPSIATRLKEGESVIADHHPDVTVLFADLVGFTPLAERLGPAAVVGLLDDIFSRFDELTEAAGLEKIKTIGDEYMTVAGLDAAGSHRRIAVVALQIREEIRLASRKRNLPLQIRVGMDRGPVVAGVIGRHKFSFDLWGDTVNTASRMQSQGVADRIHITGRVADGLRSAFDVRPRGEVDIKGKGVMPTWFLEGAADEPM